MEQRQQHAHTPRQNKIKSENFMKRPEPSLYAPAQPAQHDTRGMVNTKPSETECLADSSQALIILKLFLPVKARRIEEVSCRKTNSILR